MSDAEIEIAFQFWFPHYQHHKIDIEIEKLLPLNARRDWLKQVRKAQYYSAKTIAQKLKMSQQAFAKLESSEREGNISLNSLSKAAKALDCELVYGLRPLTKQKLARQIWEKLWVISINDSWIQKCAQTRRPQALAAIANLKMEDPEVKKKLLHF